MFIGFKLIDRRILISAHIGCVELEADLHRNVGIIVNAVLVYGELKCISHVSKRILGYGVIALDGERVELSGGENRVVNRGDYLCILALLEDRGIGNVEGIVIGERIESKSYLLAVHSAVTVAISHERERSVNVQLVLIGKSVAVGVCLERICIGLTYFKIVGNSVIVGVGIKEIGAELDLHNIGQRILVIVLVCEYVLDEEHIAKFATEARGYLVACHVFKNTLDQ